MMRTTVLTFSIVAASAFSVFSAHAMTTVDGSTNDVNTTAIRSETTLSPTTTSTNTRVATSRTSTGLTQEQTSCLTQATVKRETAIKSAFSTFSTSMNSAYDKRADVLEGIWSIPSRAERKTAMTNAWKTWKSETDAAKKLRKSTHKTVWTTFKNDVKACKASGIDIDINGAGIDSGN